MKEAPRRVLEYQEARKPIARSYVGWVCAVLVTGPIGLLLLYCLWDAWATPLPRERGAAGFFAGGFSIIIALEILSVLARSKIATALVVAVFAFVLVRLIAGGLDGITAGPQIAVYVAVMVYVIIVIATQLWWWRQLRRRF